MPELFPSIPVFVICALIVVVGQVIYASVGFGAGLFSLATMALVSPDLAGIIVSLFLLNLVTELCVLPRVWRHGRVRLLLGLIPGTLLGLWLGAQILADAAPEVLKRVLGVVVLGMGVWFLWERRRECEGESNAKGGSSHAAKRWLTNVPVGLTAGTLMALFGTGGPPVVAVLRGYQLDKASFRATLLWFFFCVSLARAVVYVDAGLLTSSDFLTALWLLPASLAGVVLGMIIHRWLNEEQFGKAVAVVLILLGLLLTFGGDRSRNTSATMAPSSSVTRIVA